MAMRNRNEPTRLTTAKMNAAPNRASRPTPADAVIAYAAIMASSKKT
jgi:hypothetical protein